jgi:pseudouridine synthase
VRERLQKLLAQAGYGSRRSAEALIVAGRVRVNGRIVNELGTLVDPHHDSIELDGRRIAASAPPVYLALHKPAGYVTTARDPQKRRTVMELLPVGAPPHTLPVGRLDAATEGLLLFTNDGALAHRIAHPRYWIDKEYLALVEGSPDALSLGALRTGVVIDGARTAPADAECFEPHGLATPPRHSWVRLVLHEGRKRQVRRMCLAVGHPVRRLIRVRVGPVALGRLAPGMARPLTRRELRELHALTDTPRGQAKGLDE